VATFLPAFFAVTSYSCEVEFATYSKIHFTHLQQYDENHLIVFTSQEYVTAKKTAEK